MNKHIAAILAASLAFTSVFVFTATSAEGTQNKVHLCHAAGRDGTDHYVHLHLSENAVFKTNGGHFYENGTPQAGHEDDFVISDSDWAAGVTCDGPPDTTPTTPTTEGDDPDPTTTTTAPPCEEDMDCWDCETMGNGDCGPTTTVPEPPTTVPPVVTCDDNGTCLIPPLVIEKPAPAPAAPKATPVVAEPQVTG